ncbi:DNA helicase PcrA [Microaerobacter geothermalis]|uniref:DNA helicase PcrA n=1 Tax=Microaerobacter geothermalis TaxID=674972 RepID=UPI0038B2CB53
MTIAKREKEIPLLKGLNDQQKKGVMTTEGPVLIMAGAGSGKTKVLTHRIAYLIYEKHILPWNILAITFTNKAAKEMKDRIVQLVGKTAEDIWISTFHSMCVRILRRDIDRIGYDRNFSILDVGDQLSLIKQVMKDLNIDQKRVEPRAVRSSISQAKNELVTPERFSNKAKDFYQQTVAKVYTEYQKRLKMSSSLDFDDLIMKTVDLFTGVHEVLDFYQRKFQYIHVDEYQDTNRAQYMLVRMLSDFHRNVCVVGDTDQSIYAFRGADISNILSFEKDYEDAKVIPLEQNYRSTKRILQAANEVVKHNIERKPKNLWTENEEGEKLYLLESDSEHGEAYYIVDEILKGIKEGYSYKDFAVLYRTNAQSRVVEEIFVKSNIPYMMVGGTKFYERKEIKDVLAYLRVVANPNDDISFMRIIHVPKRGIGSATMEKTASYAASRGISIFQAIKNEVERIGLSPRFQNILTTFVQFISNLSQMSEYLSVSELTEEVLKRTEYRELLKKEGTLEAASRLENIEEFLSVTKDFEEKNEDKSLVSFLSELALVSDIDGAEEKGQENDNKVLLMTIHSAKGLEFPVVFLIGMEEGLFPHSRALFEEREMEEERRLAYVAITRAKKKLHITRAKIRTLYGRTNMNPPSRFISEIPAELIHTFSPDNGTGSGKTMGFNQGVSVASRVNSFPKKEMGEWYPGEKVHHSKWGIGTVVSVKGEGNDMELNIAFPQPTGLRRLLVAFAPISKIDDMKGGC